MLRHGKSDWNADYDHDSKRPLAGRGQRAAALMGRLLTAAGKTPDFVLSSPAVRAVQTAEIAREAGGWDAPLHIVDPFYGGNPEEVLMALRSLPDGVSRPMLIGHEPNWSASVELLIGGGDLRMPTGSAAGLEVLVEQWGSLGPGTCRLRYLLPPRLFADILPA